MYHLSKWTILLSVNALFLVTPLSVEAGGLPYNGYPSLEEAEEDIYGDHFEAAYKMKEWGIFQGYGDGTFGGERTINRAELAKTLVLATGLSNEEVKTSVKSYDKAHGTQDYFWDIDKKAWYAPYVRYAQMQGWISGHPDGSYKPADSVLYSEAYKMLVESQYGHPDETYEGNKWYERYVNFLEKAEIIYCEYCSYSYFSNTYYYTGEWGGRVEGQALRSDIAELLYRLKMMRESGFDIYKPAMNLSSYVEQYGAIIEEKAEGILTIVDPYFGFELGSVWIGNRDPESLKIWVRDPNGFKNGWYTQWELLYPTLDADEKFPIDYDSIFTVTIYDPDYQEKTLTVECRSGIPYDLEWEDAWLMCREGSPEDNLQFTSYGEEFEGTAYSLREKFGRKPSSLELTNKLRIIVGGLYHGVKKLSDAMDVSDLIETAENEWVRIYTNLDYKKTLAAYQNLEKRKTYTGIINELIGNTDLEVILGNWLESHLLEIKNYLDVSKKILDFYKAGQGLDDPEQTRSYDESTYPAYSRVYDSERIFEGVLVQYEKSIIMAGSDTITFEMVIEERSSSEYGWFYYPSSYTLTEGEILPDIWGGGKFILLH